MKNFFLLIIAAVLFSACSSVPRGNSPGYSHSRHWEPGALEAENFERQRHYP